MWQDGLQAFANPDAIDFVCVDTETADTRRSSICSVGIAVVSDGRVVHEFEEVIDPQCDFNPFNTHIHGLDAAAVRGARTLPELWPDFVEVCRGRSLVFHNAAFDVAVLRSSAAAHRLDGFEADLTCSMRLARRVWPTLPSYALAKLARDLGIEFRHHRAGSDARACAEITLALLHARSVNDLTALHAALDSGFGRFGLDSFTPMWVKPTIEGLKSRGADPGACEDSPLFELTVCFTGALLSTVRRDAADLVCAAGGSFVANMSKKVDLLVLGDADYLAFADGHTTGKLTKAADLRAEGEGPEIVREADFFRMIAV
jgi:DNA polymerase-3 subunit epsilon